MRCRTGLAIAAALLTTALVIGPGAARAQEQYPSRNIRIVVPTTPGALTDAIARAVGQALSQAWGQAVIIDNRPGGNELLGGEAVAKAAPDGYTLLISSNAGVTTAPFLNKQMRYDPMKDLMLLFALGQATPVMVVPASSPVRGVKDLIELAKSKPGELNYGSFGVGSYSHVAMEDFKKRTGTNMMHLPYKGASPAYTAMLRNEIAVMIANLSGARAQADAGKVRIIAAAGAQRSQARPDLPTVAESGVPGFSTGAWWGLFGPAKLPAPIVAKIRSEMIKAVSTPEMKKIYAANTMEPVKAEPTQYDQFLKDDLKHWEQAVKAAGIQPN